MSDALEIQVPLTPGVRAVEFRALEGTIRSIDLPFSLPPHTRMLRFGRWGAVLFPCGYGRTEEVEVRLTGQALQEERTKWRTHTIERPSCEEPPLERTFDTLERGSLDTAWLPAVDPRLIRAAMFFRDLDIETSSALIGASRTRHRYTRVADEAERNFRMNLIEADGQFARGYLCGRIQERFGDNTPRSSTANQTHVAYLSSLQLAVLDAHYGKTEHEEIRLAYEAFAAGDLLLRVMPTTDEQRDPSTYQVSNGGPNSSLLFCFAEFAVVAIQQAIDTKRWTALLPALVAAQEVFPHAFGIVEGGKVKAIDENYYALDSRINYINGPRPVSLRTRKRIADRYANRGFDDLNRASTRNVRAAISGFMLSAPSR